MPGKVLIFHLSRFGYADYAAGMIDHLPMNDCLIFLSKWHSLSVKKPFETVPTYRNGREFLFSTLFNLPRLGWKTFRQTKKRGLRTALFLGFHYWDLPLILLCRRLGLRVIYVVHDGILHEGENYWHHRWLQNACIRQASELIFLTRFMERETRRQLHFSAPAQVVPHGLVESPGVKTERQFSQPLRLLFLGRLSKYKGLEALYRAVQLAGDADFQHLTIAGKPIYRLHLPAHPKIRLVEKRLSRSEIADLVNCHDALILPYQSATQSGVVMLGITAGIPMICTKVGGLPEQLAENEAVWVSPDPVGILEGICRLNENPALWQALHKRLMEKKKQFSWAELAGKLVAVLREPS